MPFLYLVPALSPSCLLCGYSVCVVVIPAYTCYIILVVPILITCYIVILILPTLLLSCCILATTPNLCHFATCSILGVSLAATAPSPLLATNMFAATTFQPPT